MPVVMMQDPRRIRPLVLFLISVYSLVFNPIFARTPSDDESEISVLVGKLFDASRNEDLKTLLSLWSEASPDLPSVKQGNRSVFGTAGPELGSFSLSKIDITGSEAVARVIVQTNTSRPEPGLLDPPPALLNRTL